MKLSRCLLIVAAVLAGILPAVAGQAVDHLVTALLGDTPLISDLRDLTDTVGGRPTGSEANRRAVSWALARFEAAGDTAAPDVVGRSHDMAIQFNGMSLRIPPRTVQTLHFAVEQSEADGAPRTDPQPFHLPGQVKDQGHVAAVVQGAGAQSPGVQMGADDHELFR